MEDTESDFLRKHETENIFMVSQHSVNIWSTLTKNQIEKSKRSDSLKN
jgi:hypothetical protein